MDIRGYHNSMLANQPDLYGGTGTAADTDIWLPFTGEDKNRSFGAVRAFNNQTAQTALIEYGTAGKRTYRNSQGRALYCIPPKTEMLSMAATNASGNRDLIVNMWVRANGSVAAASSVYEIARIYWSDDPLSTLTVPKEYYSLRVGQYGNGYLYVSVGVLNRYSSSAYVPYTTNSNATATNWNMVTFRFWRSTDSNGTNACRLYYYANKTAKNTSVYTQITNWPLYFSGVFSVGNSTYTGMDIAGFRIRMPHSSSSITSLMNSLYTEYN